MKAMVCFWTKARLATLPQRKPSSGPSVSAAVVADMVWVGFMAWELVITNHQMVGENRNSWTSDWSLMESSGAGY